MMPTDLPGYYFDTNKNKYFRIQPNHIAPSGAKYARQSVNAERAKDEAEHKQQAKQEVQRKAKIKRDPFLKHPLTSFQRQLGDLRFSSTRSAAHCYGITIKPQQQCTFSTPGTKFAIDPTSKGLFALQKPRSGRHPEFGVAHWDIEKQSYSNDRYTPIFDAQNIVCVAAFTSEAVVWVSSSYYTAWSPGSFIHHSTKHNLEDVPWNRNEFGDYGTVRLISPTTVFDIAVSPAENCYVLATVNGTMLYESASSTELAVPRGCTKAEQMAVAFKDRYVYMSGARSGKVFFGDVRGGQALRIQHHGAVSGLRVLRNENYVVVNGLTQTSIYDLRFTLAPSSHMPVNPQYGHYSPSKPLLNFHIGPSSPHNHIHLQKRFGLGFDYDPVTNIVASAATDFANDYRVGLWDASTGKMIKSPLNEHRFKRPVTCLEFADLRDGQQKSLLTLSDGRIQEWSTFESENDIEDGMESGVRDAGKSRTHTGSADTEWNGFSD